MTDEKMTMFRNRLTRVFRHRARQAKRLGISCYRVYDHDLPECPLCIDIHGNKVHVAEYQRKHRMTDAEHEQWQCAAVAVIEEVLGVEADAVFYKTRQRKTGRAGQYRKLGEAQDEFIVEENGLRFLVNLGDYLDTGLFLDHRLTREMVRTKSNEKKVLNLFAYTGSFSVYAAAGGATEVVTVDLSRTYLDWAQRNMVLNGFSDPDQYTYFQADVKQYLPLIPADSFDIIIMDPPSFSNSKRMEDFLDIQRDHVPMINRCLDILRPGGFLVFSTNLTRFTFMSGEINSGSVNDITRTTTSFDFEGKPGRFCYLIYR